MQRTGKIRNTISIILIILILPILFVNLVILVKSFTNPNEIPGFMGYKPFVVLSGSMETAIYTGDLAVVKQIDVNTLQENDIIAYKAGKSVIVHRIVQKTDKNGAVEFITKGDNNNTEDDVPVALDKIEGKYLFKISKLGYFIMFLQQPLGLVVSVSIPILLIIIIQVSNNRKYKKELEKLTKKENK